MGDYRAVDLAHPFGVLPPGANLLGMADSLGEQEAQGTLAELLDDPAVVLVMSPAPGKARRLMHYPGARESAGEIAEQMMGWYFLSVDLSIRPLALLVRLIRLALRDLYRH